MFVAHSLDVGGTEKLLCDMVTAVSARGIEPVVCCLDRVGIWGERLCADGYTVHDLGRKPGVDRGVIGRLRAIISTERPDILNPHQYTPYFYAASSIFLLPGRPRLVFTEHGRFYPDRVRWKRVIFNRFAATFTDEIVGVCGYSRDALVKYEWFPRRRVKVIYNGIKADVYRGAGDASAVRRAKQALGLSPDDIVIGTVGRLCAEKNYRMLIRAFAQVLRIVPSARLVFAGGGELESNLRKCAGEVGADAKIVFLGPRQDVPSLLGAFDIFALSSDSEGASLVLLESMAAGLPVVATAAGGNPELVVDGVTGLLVPRGDADRFARALIDLAGSDQRRRLLGDAGRKRVDEKFSFDRMIDEYVALYRGIAGSKGGEGIS